MLWINLDLTQHTDSRNKCFVEQLNALTLYHVVLTFKDRKGVF